MALCSALPPALEMVFEIRDTILRHAGRPRRSVLPIQGEAGSQDMLIRHIASLYSALGAEAGSQTWTRRAAGRRNRRVKSPGRELRDLLFFPVRAAVLDDRVPWLGLTPLRQERIDACVPYVRGRLLDVGCGENLLVKAYADSPASGPGIGVDVFPWPGVNALCDSRRLPFPDGSFDTAALIACLNHIPDREQVLNEVHRVLVPGGRLIVTMIDPFVGYWAHRVTHILDTDPDGCERERKPGEHWGLWSNEVRRLLAEAGFAVRRHRRFVYGMNQLFVAEARER